MIEHLLDAERIGMWIQEVRASRRAGSVKKDYRSIRDTVTRAYRLTGIDCPSVIHEPLKVPT